MKNYIRGQSLFVNEAKLGGNVDGLGDAAKVEAGHQRKLQVHLVLLLQQEGVRDS